MTIVQDRTREVKGAGDKLDFSHWTYERRWSDREWHTINERLSTASFVAWLQGGLAMQFRCDLTFRNQSVGAAGATTALRAWHQGLATGFGVPVLVCGVLETHASGAFHWHTTVRVGARGDRAPVFLPDDLRRSWRRGRVFLRYLRGRRRRGAAGAVGYAVKDVVKRAYRNGDCVYLDECQPAAWGPGTFWHGHDQDGPGSAAAECSGRLARSVSTDPAARPSVPAPVANVAMHSGTGARDRCCGASSDRGPAAGPPLVPQGSAAQPGGRPGRRGRGPRLAQHVARTWSLQLLGCARACDQRG